MIAKIKTSIIRLVQILLYFIPIKKNRVMFFAFNRKGIVCNPAALMDYMWRNTPEQYELIWVTRFPETCDARVGVTVVKHRSLSFFRLFIRTKYFISNDMIDEALVKKKGQVFLTTWHGGGAYKKVGISTTGENAEFARKFSKWYGRLDYFVSSCDKCTKMYSEAFDLPQDCFLETGTPRNDIFFQDHPEVPLRVRNFYHIPEQTKILLFAPSFQLTAPEKEQYDRQQLAEIAEELGKKTGDSWVILYRSHYFSDTEKQDIQENILDGNAYYEMQDLLYTADILVTDFSSCIWDFSLTGRPVIVMEYRLQEYKKEDRGFFVPYETWPYLKIREIRELTEVIITNQNKDFSSVYEKHWNQMGSFEKGHACERLLNIMQQNGGNDTDNE